MTLPSLDTIVAYTTICFAIFGALLAALWLSLIIWTFRDMRSRSRDPFAQILAALVVAVLPVVGLLVYLILRPPETLAEAYERALEEEALLQQIEEKPTCPGCSRTIDPNWILCAHCHTRLKKACPDCDSLMDLHWTICPHCGNEHVDPYHVGPPIVTTIDEEMRDEEESISISSLETDGQDLGGIEEFEENVEDFDPFSKSNDITE